MFGINIQIHISDFWKLAVSEIFYIRCPRFDVCWGEPFLGPEYDCLGKLQQTHLLSGLRFSTAVWVWLVVRTETCSPSGPLAVEMTSYSEGRTANSGPGVHTWSEEMLLHTGGVIVWFFPVQDDKGRASFHRHYSKVGRRRTRWRSHIHLARFIFWEVVEGVGDGARLVVFLARLVDDMRRFGSRRSLISQNPSTSLAWVWSVGPPTYISFLSKSIKVRRWLWFEELRVFPGFLSTCWINKKDNFEKPPWRNYSLKKCTWEINVQPEQVGLKTSLCTCCCWGKRGGLFPVLFGRLGGH